MPRLPTSHPSFHGRTALVTGAASGIGAALVEALLASGAEVVATDVDEAALHRSPWASRAHRRRLDVTDAEACAALVEGLPRLDLAFHNAGVLAGGAFETFDLPTLRRVVDVNLWGVLHGTHAAYRRMVAQGSGQIVNVASMAGLHPVPYSAVYTATKHAVVGFSLALRTEAEHRGVRVSVACPGLVDTGIFDASLDRGGYSYRRAIAGGPAGSVTPAEAANAILRGAAADEPLIVFPGSARLLALAQRVAPSLLRGAIAHSMRPKRNP